MEVHHHPHIKEKKFKEYFLEFIMIFFAVTLGFFAETIRENITENKIANELAESLYKEVYSDSIKCKSEIARHIKIGNACNHFIDYVRDSSLTNLSDEFYEDFGIVFFAIGGFEPNDGILNQLRNSGTLRYFKNSRIEEAIGGLSVAIASVRIRNAQNFDFVQFTLKPFALKHYDFRQNETLNQQKFNKLVKQKILNTDQFNREEAVNLVSMYAMVLEGTCNGAYQRYVEKNHHLLETLRKKYHLKDE
jgi:hypothetical protein